MRMHSSVLVVCFFPNVVAVTVLTVYCTGCECGCGGDAFWSWLAVVTAFVSFTLAYPNGSFFILSPLSFTLYPLSFDITARARAPTARRRARTQPAKHLKKMFKV